MAQAPATITVGQEQCVSANARTTLRTIGLDTCIGIVAYGWPGVQGGVNKVMAHTSGLHVQTVMAEFVFQVQNSGMSLAGICMSCPKHDRNDNGPRKVSDRTIKQAIAQQYNIPEKQVSKEQVQQWRDEMSLALADTQDYVEQVCINNFSVGPLSHPRSNSRTADPHPYGSMYATASPRGQVKADGHKLADIPEPDQSTATNARSGGGNHGSASGSSRHAGSSFGPGGHSSSSSRPSGHSSSSSHPSGTSSARPSGYSSSSAKPSGYSSSSARPSGYSSSSARPSGSSRTTATTGSSARVQAKPSSTSTRR